MDINELRELNLDRLGALEASLRKQIFDARIKNFTNQLDDTASIRRLRKDLARIKTVQSERLLSDEPEAAAESAEEAEAAEEAEGDAESNEEADGVEEAD